MKTRHDDCECHLLCGEWVTHPEKQRNMHKSTKTTTTTRNRKTEKPLSAADCLLWNENSKQWRNNHIPLKLFACHLIWCSELSFPAASGGACHARNTNEKCALEKSFSIVFHLPLSFSRVMLSTVIGDMITVHLLPPFFAWSTSETCEMIREYDGEKNKRKFGKCQQMHCLLIRLSLCDTPEILVVASK